MSFSTFSGPVRSGTVREGAGRNTGLVILAQSATIAATNAKTSGATQVDLGILPAGSKILRFNVGVISEISGGSVNAVSIIIGTTADDNKYLTSTATGTSVGAVDPTDIATNFQVAECDNIGTSDVAVKALLTATGGNPTAGSIDVTVEYVQRNSNGAQNPVSA